MTQRGGERTAFWIGWGGGDKPAGILGLNRLDCGAGNPSYRLHVSFVPWVASISHHQILGSSLGFHYGSHRGW